MNLPRRFHCGKHSKSCTNRIQWSNITSWVFWSYWLPHFATAAMIGVSVSQKNKSSSKDCATASYTEEPFLLLPESSQSIRAGKFGTSISASSNYLIVGAPNSACNSQGSLCANFTIGGEAYLIIFVQTQQQKWMGTLLFFYPGWRCVKWRSIW